MNRSVVLIVLGVFVALVLGVPGCFTPDLQGLPCQTDQQCANLKCIQGLCGGQSEASITPDGVSSESQSDAVTESPAQEANPEKNTETGVELPADSRTEASTEKVTTQDASADEGPSEQAIEPLSDTQTQEVPSKDEPLRDAPPAERPAADRPAADQPANEQPAADQSPPEVRPEIAPELPSGTCVNDGERRRCLPSKGCSVDSAGRVTCNGECRSGFETCMAGKWGPCLGAVEPAAKESCNSKDDDCDGMYDEFIICPDPTHVCINGVCKKDPGGVAGNYAECFDDNSCQSGSVCFDVGSGAAPYKVCAKKCSATNNACQSDHGCMGPKGAPFSAGSPVACLIACQSQTHCAQGTPNWRNFQCAGIHHKPPGWTTAVKSCLK